MKVNTLVQSNAQIIQITEVQVGDIYKRLDKPNDYTAERLVFGTVTDLMSNGEEAVLVVLEFIPPAYGGAAVPTIKTFRSEAELALFPATLTEFVVHMDATVAKQQDSVDATARELEQKQGVLVQMKAAQARELTEPALLHKAVEA